MSGAKAGAAAVDGDRAALVSLLRQLVAVDTSSSRSNLGLVELLERRLGELGLSCTRQRYVDEAGTEKANLLATTSEGLPELALVGHTDCVPFDPSWSDALALAERDGRLFGRGACDTKGFIACAVRALERTRARLRRPLLLAFTADEEVGCAGARRLVDEGLGRCRRAIVGEPTALAPVRASKGYCSATVEVLGREGHSAYPATGRSAIFGAARLLEAIARYAAGPLASVTASGFDPAHATLNVGLVSGGRARNVIPGACRFTVEWRPLPGQAVDEVLRALEAQCAALAAEVPGCTATVTPERMDGGFSTAEDAELVQFLAERSGRAPLSVSFGTEAPQLCALGAQTVVFGPGDITVAHQTGEYVAVDALVQAQAVLEAAVLRFCG